MCTSVFSFSRVPPFDDAGNAALALLAVDTGVISACVKYVPNQPIYFHVNLSLSSNYCFLLFKLLTKIGTSYHSQLFSFEMFIFSYLYRANIIFRIHVARNTHVTHTHALHTCCCTHMLHVVTCCMLHVACMLHVTDLRMECISM